MKEVFFVLSLLLSFTFFSSGQTNVTGPIVQSPVYFDVSPPLRDMVKNLPKKAETSWKDGIVKNRFNTRPKPSGQAPGGLSDPNLQTDNGLIITDTTIVNFDGNTNTQGYYPPDTYGDVGPSHYFQVVNCHYSIYSKTGTLLLGPLDNSSIFSGFPNNSNDGDAVVVYDEVADRWLFSQFSLPTYPAGPFYQMIAVSQTADPTGSWYRYQYTFTDMPDYPKFGSWGDGYYMSMNRFASNSGNWKGTGAVAYDRTKMLAGDPTASMVMFTKPATDEAYSWLPSDCDGPFPTGNPPNYFLYMYDGTSNDHLGIYEFHVDWVNTANSTFGNFLSLPVNAFTTSITGIPQPGTTYEVDPLNDRMMYRLQYRKFSDHAAMVCNHTVDITSNVVGIRWYELRKTTGAWSIYQQSTYSIADNNSRWMASMAMDTGGNIALGYSISSSSLFPSIRYTGRLKNDALNTMTIGERGIYNGSGSQTGTALRWGDYSSMTIDPSATSTFWYTQEYYQTTSSIGWRTRIASFRFSRLPIVVTQAATAVTSTGATLNGTVNPNGIATNYQFNWGTSTSYGNNTVLQPAGSGTTVVPVTAILTGLTTGVTYHYRLTATNSDGTSNGLDMTVTPGGPVVTTTAASAITSNSATSGGNVTADGGAPVTARGVCWGTSPNPTIAGSHTTDGSGTGTFTSSITGLTGNTTYHYRAYATNSTATTYGTDLTFTTLCGIINLLPFSEGFSGTSIPNCWSTATSGSPSQSWVVGTASSNGITGTVPPYAYCFYNTTQATGSAYLVSPVFDFTSIDNITLGFKYYYYLRVSSSTVTVDYSIDGGSTWSNIVTYAGTGGGTSSANPATFSQLIPALAGQSNVKFRWGLNTASGSWACYFSMDDITLNAPGIWVGGTVGSLTNWETPANWSDGNVPTASTNVYIPQRTYLPVVYSTTAACNNLVIESNSGFSVNASQKITVNGKMTLK